MAYVYRPPNMPPVTKEEHYVTLDPEGEDEPLRILKGEGSPKITGGYGGWTVANRPHQVGLTVFTGLDPIRMSIPVVFEGWPGTDGQEIRIGRLSRMGLPHGANNEPSVVRISGLGVPKPGPLRWVVESLDWGDNVIWDTGDDGSMVRLRQDCTINLLQYVAEDRVAFSKLPQAKPGGGAWPKHYVWKKGDTLRKVAAHFYHNSKKWKLIAKANNIRDPKSIKPKRVLRIPKP
jgi:LysM repeat protein